MTIDRRFILFLSIEETLIMCVECQQLEQADGLGHWECHGEEAMPGSDSWSNWRPDPLRVFREHDPASEPYASMTKEAILEAMYEARGGLEWESLREFLVDKCDEEEKQYDRFVTLLTGSNGERAEFRFINDVAGPPTRLIVPVSA